MAWIDGVACPTCGGDWRRARKEAGVFTFECAEFHEWSERKPEMWR